PSRPLSRLATRLPPTSPLFPYTTLFRAPPRPRGPGRGRRYGSSASSSSARDREPAYGDGGGTPAGVRRDVGDVDPGRERRGVEGDRKSTRLNSSHVKISYAVFCLKKKKR